MAKTGTVTETFDTTDTAKWDFDTQATVSGGQLHIAPTVANVYHSIVHGFAAPEDATESFYHVELVQALNVGNGGTELVIGLDASSGNEVMFYINNGTLYFIERVAGVDSTTSVAYNATNHRWLQLRHAGTTIYWEVSATGIAGSWTTARSKTAVVDLTEVKMQITAGYFGTEPAPGELIADNVNITPAGGGGGAKTETITDAFNTQNTAIWTFDAGTSVSSGQLHIAPTVANVYPSVMHGEAGPEDGTESYFLWELVQNLNAGNGGTEFDAGFDASPGNGVFFYINNGTLGFYERVAAVDDFTTVTYNATNHRWMRLRHAGTTVYWEVSATGIAGSWTTARSKTVVVDLTEVKMYFRAGYFGTEPAPGELLVDNVNLAPTAAPSSGGGWTVGTYSAAGGPDGGGGGGGESRAPTGDLPFAPNPGAANWTHLWHTNFDQPAALGSWANPGSGDVVYTDENGNDFSTYPQSLLDTYQGRPYRPDQVIHVADSKLTFYLHPVNGQAAGAVAWPYLPGANSPFVTYGRFELRMMADPNLQEYRLTPMLWPQADPWPDNGEIDYPEGQGTHEPYGFHHYARAAGGQDSGATGGSFLDWNVYTIEWSPGRVRFLFNGVQIMNSTNFVPSGPMFWALQMDTQTEAGDWDGTWHSGNVYIDWMSCWAYTPT